MLDVYNINIPKIDVDVLFLGGGAIFSTTKFINDINSITANINAKHIIVWGAGFNPALNENIRAKYDLVGIRDWGVPRYQWVPCPSVLHPSLLTNIDRTPTKDFLIVDHWKRPIDFDGDCTRINNKPNNIQNIISLIADHRYVLTSSYHAAYWATLLKKKTFVIGDSMPEKFYTMKHKPLFASKFEHKLIDQAIIHDDAYNDCMLATNEFKSQVEYVTNIPFAFL